MAVTFQTATSGGGPTSATSLVVSKPSGVIDGDLLIVAIGGTDGSSSDTINSVPAGWTQIDYDISLANGSLALNNLYTFYKVASSEPATWTWGFTAANMNRSWISARFDTFNTASPIDSHNIAHIDNSTTPTWSNTITPTMTNHMLVGIVWAGRSNSTTISSFAIATNNPTWTTQLTQSTTGGTMALFTATRPEITATGTSSATIGASGSPVTPSIAALIAIGRLNTFSATITDNAIVTDVIIASTGLNVTLTDTLTSSDAITATKGRVWTNDTKNTGTWTNDIKH